MLGPYEETCYTGKRAEAASTKELYRARGTEERHDGCRVEEEARDHTSSNQGSVVIELQFLLTDPGAQRGKEIEASIEWEWLGTSALFPSVKCPSRVGKREGSQCYDCFFKDVGAFLSSILDHSQFSSLKRCKGRLNFGS